MADEFRLYNTGMHRRSTYAALTMPAVESYSKKDIRSLRAAIRN